MTRGVGAALWVAGALMLGGTQMGGCKDDSGSGGSQTGLGANTPIQWFNTATTGSGPIGDTPMQWNDPQTGPAARPPRDPSDIRTYTNPDIYYIGNKHPLMTQVEARTHPFVIGPENNLTGYIQDFRYDYWVDQTGDPPARGAIINEYVQLRQIARAHCKHYAVHHPNDPFPYINAEGDEVLMNGSYVGDGVGDWFSYTVRPWQGMAEIPHNYPPPAGFGSDGRIPKCRLRVLAAGELIVAGQDYMDPFAVFQLWTANHSNFLLWTQVTNGETWTHMGVGYWRAPGTNLVHYWSLVFAINPQSDFNNNTTFPLPFP